MTTAAPGRAPTGPQERLLGALCPELAALEIEVSGHPAKPTLEEFVASPQYGALPLSSAQRALVLAADGIAPTHLDAEATRYHFGAERIEISQRPMFVLCRSGRRSGKSLLAALIALLFGALFCELRRPPGEGETPGPDGLVGVRPGEFVRGVVVTPRVQQARGTFRHLVGAVRNSPKLKKHIVSDNTESMVLRRADGHEVTIEILAASPKGTNLRSSWFIGAVLDEAAFFQERDASINLVEQRDAIVPALCRGGQVWIVSSPWADDDDFSKSFEESFGNPSETLAFHSDSMRMNPTLDRAVVERLRAKDPDFVAREYDAVPMASTGMGWFSTAAIAAACVRTERILPPNDAPHWAGSDLGFRKNSSALALARREDWRKGEGHVARAVLAYFEELIPEKGRPLKPSAVIASFAKAALRYRAASVVGDGIYQATADEEFPKTVSDDGRQVYYDCWSTSLEAEVFTEFRRRMNEGLLDLPNDPRIIQQLQDTKQRKLANGRVGPLVPRTGAAHGDLMVAIVLACVQVPLDEEPPEDAATSELDDDEGFRFGDDRGFG